MPRIELKQIETAAPEKHAGRLGLFLMVMLAAPLLASSIVGAEPRAMQHISHLSDTSSTLVRKVRQATQPFMNVNQAMGAGYQQFLGCVSGPQEGAMGVHFVNSHYVGDGELDVDHPEALIYEFRNGSARLVGVEYIVMADDWNARHPSLPYWRARCFSTTAARTVTVYRRFTNSTCGRGKTIRTVRSWIGTRRYRVRGSEIGL